MTMTAGQRAVWVLLNSRSNSAFRLLVGSYPDPEEVPGLDDVSKVVVKSWYSSGYGDLVSVLSRIPGELKPSLEKSVSTVDGSVTADEAVMDLIREKARQSILTSLGKCVAGVQSGEIDPYKVYEIISSEVHNLPRSSIEDLELAVDRSVEELRLEELDSSPVLNTGIPLLDSTFRFRRRMLSTVAAPTSHGKTAFSIHLICRALEIGLRVIYVCLEDYLIAPQKMAARLTGVPIFNFTRYREVGKSDREKAQDALQVLKEFRGQLTICGGLRLGELESLAVRIRPDVVILDYLQKYAEVYGTGDRRVDCSAATSVLQEIVKKVNAYGIMTSQIRRRELTDGFKTHRRPTISDLKESGDIENYSDAVLLLHWPWKDRTGDDPNYQMGQEEYRITVAKDKCGQGGEVRARFDPAHLTFRGA